MVDVNTLETMLSDGKDSALLRFSLGSVFIKHEKYKEAIQHLAVAVELDPGYSAAWKLYGKALTKTGQTEKAAAVYLEGISAAEKKGDIQAVKEMTVFLNRLSS